ncbi:MAG: ABC transporter permease [Bacteroidales bacterium]|nr:ABC transporter permease [Bacteroidales bacterium]
MSYINLFIIAYRSLSKNKVRSFLTMLGIIIGVASVIAMLAIGQGSRKSIEQQIAGLGSNVLMVFPGSSFRGGVSSGAGTGQRLVIDDAWAIRDECPSVKYVSPVARTSAQVIAGANNWNTQITGIYPEYFKIRDLKIESGTLFTDKDAARGTKVCVLGKTVVKNLFGEGADPVGERVRIRNIPFRVIGVMQAKGQSGMGTDEDDIIYAPFQTVQRRLRGQTTRIQMIYVSAASEELMDQAQQEIDNLLRQRKHIARNDEDVPFRIRNQQEILDMLTSTSDTMVGLLASIAAISLLVGGIGIMNIMLVSVTERTREIGLRMAVGARSKDILRQFLLEAILLSFLGGLLGVILGVGSSRLFVSLLGWPVSVTSYSIFLAFIFAALVGIFFGWYPARKAANLIPMEALRYE